VAAASHVTPGASVTLPVERGVGTGPLETVPQRLGPGPEMGRRDHLTGLSIEPVDLDVTREQVSAEND
jgi:hypothetical protein